MSTDGCWCFSEWTDKSTLILEKNIRKIVKKYPILTSNLNILGRPSSLYMHDIKMKKIKKEFVLEKKAVNNCKIIENEIKEIAKKENIAVRSVVYCAIHKSPLFYITIIINEKKDAIIYISISKKIVNVSVYYELVNEILNADVTFEEETSRVRKYSLKLDSKTNQESLYSVKNVKILIFSYMIWILSYIAACISYNETEKYEKYVMLDQRELLKIKRRFNNVVDNTDICISKAIKYMINVNLKKTDLLMYDSFYVSKHEICRHCNIMDVNKMINPVNKHDSEVYDNISIPNRIIKIYNLIDVTNCKKNECENCFIMHIPINKKGADIIIWKPYENIIGIKINMYK